MDFLQLVSKNKLWYSGLPMKNLILFCFTSFGLFANPMLDFSSNQKIAVQNSILARVNGKTISMMDVKKKMDLQFHQSYPQYANSPQARIQYYEMSWRHVLMDLIDNELIISDALDKEIKLSDGEVRETMEERFGPNVMQTLDRIGLTYDETWKMIKNEMIVQRMSWYFVQSKAMNSVTPQDIRQAYRLHLEKNPAYSEWKYQVISIRADKADDSLAEEIYDFLIDTQPDPKTLEKALKKWETPDTSISISSEFKAKTQELSDIHKTSLAALEPGNYSKPSFQISRADKKTVYRIFYLIDKTDFPAPPFETLSNQLRSDLMQKAVVQESQVYLEKLRKHYGFEADKTLPEDLHPFSLQ